MCAEVGDGDGDGEIIGAVALTVFTNCFDSVARTGVDFPAVDVPVTV
ncbi:hypothetical protein ACFYYB_21535 [Streptomyces sp. NPDC002886]